MNYLNIYITQLKNVQILFNFSNSDIKKIIQNVDPSIAHGHDKISICKRLWRKFVLKELTLILSVRMEKGKRISVHKKVDRKC